MSVTDEIKARLDIVNFISNYVELKKSGRNYKALCPFHSEKTPSFVVFPDSQQWRCFGACGEGGDIFSFVMKTEGWDFPEALRYLAEQAGVEIKPITPQQADEREESERLQALLREALEFYYRQLTDSPNAAHAREYVEQRGLGTETIHTFGIGYAPHSWDSTLNTLLEKGYTRQDLVNVGLVIEKDDGGIYDRFRDRLMIPIHDIRGNVAGFGARALTKDAKPKYINSPQNAIFDKSRLLYGMAYARRSIRESETAVIVEGYMDVLQAHQAGFTNVVAEMGTALTEPQLQILARYAKRLILALDPDTAGQMATDRGHDVIARVSKAAADQVEQEGDWQLDAAEREHRAKLSLEFDAKGMLHYESRLGFDIRVITLPEGQDPDDLIRDDAEAWQSLVEQATPIVDYVIDKTISGQDLDNPKVKSSIARQIVPLIEDVADPVERSHYQQRLTRLLKVPENTLFSKPPASSGGRPRKRPTGGASSIAPAPPVEGLLSGKSSPTRNREAFCLAALIRYPRLVYQVNRVLTEYLGTPERRVEGGLSTSIYQLAGGTITAGDFTLPEHQNILRAWLESIGQVEVDPLQYLQDVLDPVSLDMVDRWQSQPIYALLRDVRPDEKDFSEDKVFSEVCPALLTLRVRRLDEHYQELTFLMQDLDDGGDSFAIEQFRDTLEVLLTARRRVLKAIQRYGPTSKQLEAGGNNRLQLHSL
ncbi:MAG: DNA primase [Anaerolineae bacterium]|nr:DNA primase [Anaerolineae bacterium]